MTENKRFTLMWIPESTFSNFWIARDTGEQLNAIMVVDLLNRLNDENEQSKQILNVCRNARDNYSQRIIELEKENEQLKQRINNQARRLDNLYNLIEKQDWKTLQGIIQEFQECENERV